MAPAKAAPKKVESESEDESEEEVPAPKKATPKTAPAKAPAQPTKVTPKAAPKAAPKVASSDDSEEDSDASEEKPVKAVAKKNVPAPAAKKPAAKIEVEEDSDEDSDEEEEKPATKAKATTSQVKKAKKVEDDDEDEDDDEEEEEEKVVAKPAKATPKPAEENGSGQEYEAKIFGLSYQSTENDIREFLKDCGTINNINVLKDRNTGKPKGIAFIKFATEAALNEAITLNGSEFMGRYLEISKAEARGAYNAGAQREGGNGFSRPAAPAGDSSTCFIGNLSYGTTVETLREVFQDCGPIVDVRIAMDRNTGEVLKKFQ